jgi:uncharacterized membrane protein YgaE (UPF0421/DUF939 family)
VRLADPVSLAVKAGVASAIAVVATRALGVDDPLTSGFVALACVSPSVTGGARSGFEALAGSALACAIAGAPLVAWPALRGSPVVLGASLAAAILLCFGLRLRSAYLVAGFSVVYLHVLPFDSAASGIALRIEAVLLGVLAATLLNLVESALRAHAIAARRVRLAKAVVAHDLREGAAWLAGREDAPAPSFEAAFEVVRELRGDLEASSRERLFPGARRAREHAERGLEEAESLERAAHLAKEIALLVHERARHDADEQAAREGLEAAAGALVGERTSSPKPDVSDPVLAVALERLRDAIGHS